MTPIIADLADCRKTKAGLPIFQSTEEAYFYANFIFDDPNRIEQIRLATEITRQDLKHLREKRCEDFDLIMRMATVSQFYRECLEEVDRIHNDQFLP
ncbi:hypothetical protein ES703_29003 [subsurface metagenome]